MLMMVRDMIGADPMGMGSDYPQLLGFERLGVNERPGNF